ncbi:hypothetical protein TrLO_g13263 [Triparma laevis f. longispina]|uniref:Potassium channel domain-containing protein n=1 Tax=Triparma laevis f. longispina TaxID=1714387 RepID=A0A9W7AE76_9STRA|nr:hypothetical protein TrLO_g13263 [Triparma laevis f. longispina]
MIVEADHQDGAQLGDEHFDTPTRRQRNSSVAEQVAEGFSRIRAGTIVLVNPPRTLTTKKNTNPCVQSIIKWVKTKSFWIVWLEILIFVTVSGLIVLVLEQGHESVVEENLRSVLAKCEDTKVDGEDIITIALRSLNMTDAEKESIEESLGGRANFCEHLAWFKRIEEKTEYNWFNRWDFSSAIMFICTSISTIGYGNLAPATGAGKLATALTSMVGIPLCGFFFHRTARSVSTYMLWWTHLVHKNLVSNEYRFKPKERGGEGTRRQSDAEQVYSSVSDVRLLTISFCLVVFFAVVAAYGIHLSMGTQWNFDNSLWFIFITITTIGLGDMVPSWRDEDIKPTMGVEKLVMPFMCGLFTIIGLSFTMAIIQNVGKVFETQVLGTDDDEEGEEEGVEGDEGDRRGSVRPPPKLEGILEIDENPVQQSARRSPKSLQHGDSHI